MVLMVTGSRATARLVGLAVKGQREVFVPSGAAEEWQGRLLALVGDERPSVILLDSRAGNNQLRAVDLLRWLQRIGGLGSGCPGRSTRPSVVGLFLVVRELRQGAHVAQPLLDDADQPLLGNLRLDRLFAL